MSITTSTELMHGKYEKINRDVDASAFGIDTANIQHSSVNLLSEHKRQS